MNINAMLPVENFTLKSNLGVEELKRRIAEHIESRKVFRLSFGKNRLAKPYEGEIKKNTFRISRIINYRNSFLPLITGHIGNGADETVIIVRMRMFVFTIVFMSLWMGIAGLVGILFLWFAIFSPEKTDPHGFSLGTLAPFIMFAFG